MYLNFLCKTGPYLLKLYLIINDCTSHTSVIYFMYMMIAYCCNSQAHKISFIKVLVKYMYPVQLMSMQL